PLVTIDCGALASTLLASELFGHERGAFTGADRTHPGAFERARGGTVFLDEIGELPAADQVALLGVLERKRFRRVGGTADIELGAVRRRCARALAEASVAGQRARAAQCRRVRARRRAGGHVRRSGATADVGADGQLRDGATTAVQGRARSAAPRFRARLSRAA